MVDKTKLHLDQVVLVGEERKMAVIDGLTQTFAGVKMLEGGYEMVGYEEIYTFEDVADGVVKAFEEAYDV